MENALATDFSSRFDPSPPSSPSPWDWSSDARGKVSALKIAMFSYYLPSGSKIGVGYQAHYMANALVQRGHSVSMFTPCPACTDARYETRFVNVGQRLRSFRFAWELRKQNLSGFDVLHAHGDDHLCLPRRTACHIRTMHGSCLVEAIHVPGMKEKIRMLGLAAGEILAGVLADRTFGVSTNTCRSYPWIREVIPNGVDLSWFHPGAERESRPTILFVGTYRNRKRGKLLMEAFERSILPAAPDARLWMVCEDAPAAPGVTVFGKIPLDQLARLYRRAWLFCLPSSYEGFGVPYIEALASGTPVVATPNPGAREVLQDGKYGVITQPELLGPAILSLLQDAERRRQLSEMGLRWARNFGWDRVGAAYETAYLQVLAKRMIA